MIINIFLMLFYLGWLFILLTMIGETYATNNPTTKFTEWWRKNWVGIEE